MLTVFFGRKRAASGARIHATVIGSVRKTGRAEVARGGPRRFASRLVKGLHARSPKARDASLCPCHLSSTASNMHVKNPCAVIAARSGSDSVLQSFCIF